MARFNIHDAKTHLSRLIARAQKGEEIIIARAGKPVAKLTAVAGTPKRAPFGFAKGTITVVGDINDPLPDDLLDEFELGPVFPDERVGLRKNGRRTGTSTRKRR